MTPFRATLAQLANAGSTQAISESWEGRARMATARRNANIALDADDVEALRRHPNPPMTQPRKPAP